MSARAKPIEWENGFGTSRKGSIDGVPIWSCGYLARDRYYLQCNLPGIKQRVQVESYEAGEARAERQLATFLRRILEAPA